MLKGAGPLVMVRQRWYARATVYDITLWQRGMTIVHATVRHKSTQSSTLLAADLDRGI